MRLRIAGTIGAAILALSGTTGALIAADGQAIFESQGCTECHYTEGPAREKSIEDQLAKAGPELWYAGDKFREEWLLGWLADPQPIRIMAFNSLTEENPGEHPALGGDDATAVGEFLMGLTSGEVEAGVVKVKKNAKGRQIFTKKMPCSGCHQYAGRKGDLTGGRSGPPLQNAGNRLNPDWILAYLQKPEVFKPVKMMPVFVGLLRDKDMADVASYVANFTVEE